jgi:Alr-MurF fusion protein
LFYKVDDIAVIVNGQLAQYRQGAAIEHILLDSRKVLFPDNSLFFALKSTRRNAHLFISDLYTKGVRNFVVSEPVVMDDYKDASFILVKDTLHALHLLAAYHRKQFHIPVIGITGSNGKTIVKEWLNQLLQENYRIVRSPKSYNSQTGVPLSVWQINNHHQLAIFEAGISQPGEMEALAAIIQPNIGILTNIGAAHSEGFESQAQKTDEKIQLFRNAATLIYCRDQLIVEERMTLFINALKAQKTQVPDCFTWGSDAANTLQVLELQRQPEHTVIHALYKAMPLSISIPFTDDASVENAIHCWCVLLLLKQEEEEIRKKMLQLTQVAMRLELKKGINHCDIINDSYSADLSSLSIALDFLLQQQQHPRHTLILSDIYQSGKEATALYAEVALILEQKNIQRLIGIGADISRHQAIFDRLTGLEKIFYPSVDYFRKDFYHLHFSNETILLKGARVFEFEQISRLLEQKVHQTVLEINLTALLHNLRQYQQLLHPSTKLMAMVKAFSYGSGAAEIANILQFHKVDYLGVAYADEGVELRKSGITMPIMVMNPESSTFDALVQFNLEPEIYSCSLLHDFERFLRREGIEQYPIHIELETGMQRLGFSAEEIAALAAHLGESRQFKVQTVFSHLAGSEDPAEDDFTLEQAAGFNAAAGLLEKALPYPFIKHIANSAAITRYPDLQLDMVRLGIGLYGVDSTRNEALQLRTVSTLKSTIAQIKHLKAGVTVGYNRRGKLQRDSVIATVRIGYADGYPRRLGNGVGAMLVQGQPAPVTGSVCMDMTMIDVTDIPGVKEGDDVIVFGEALPVETLAAAAQTIPYEIMTGVSQRVQRVYFEE